MTALGMGHLTIVREGGKCTVRGRNVQRLSEDNVKIQRALTRQVLQLNKGLESWTRDQFLDPDWLRIGTDIVGQGTFNAAFVLNGVTVPGPIAGAGLPGLIAACGALLMLARHRRKINTGTTAAN
jgi:hypothetical protein